MHPNKNKSYFFIFLIAIFKTIKSDKGLQIDSYRYGFTKEVHGVVYKAKETRHIRITYI